jgi:hypothetical protein
MFVRNLMMSQFQTNVLLTWDIGPYGGIVITLRLLTFHISILSETTGPIVTMHGWSTTIYMIFGYFLELTYMLGQ